MEYVMARRVLAINNPRQHNIILEQANNPLQHNNIIILEQT